jgi:hypothetical protein
MTLPCRTIYAGTYLICPRCRERQAVLIYDIIDADKSFDWRAVRPLNANALVGVSYCCDERYITLSGMFYTENGAI